MAGAELGGVVGALVASIIGAECGKFVQKTTPIDLVITPAVTLCAGIGVAYAIAPILVKFMENLGQLIDWAMMLSPIMMSVVIAIIMGMLLTLTISSAAIAISLSLSGLSAGAATVGCAAQMIGFAVMSYRDNGILGVVAQGLGTSMLQMPNILKNPKIWLPPTLAGAVLTPFATVIFDMTNVPFGAGMGTSGFVGQVGTLNAMGTNFHVIGLILLFHIVLPAILTLLFAKIMRAQGMIKDGDLTLP